MIDHRKSAAAVLLPPEKAIARQEALRRAIYAPWQKNAVTVIL